MAGRSPPFADSYVPAEALRCGPCARHGSQPRSAADSGSGGHSGGLLRPQHQGCLTTPVLRAPGALLPGAARGALGLSFG
eukprot:5999884-Alexandrium_andersonii.AAC.1